MDSAARIFHQRKMSLDHDKKPPLQEDLLQELQEFQNYSKNASLFEPGMA